MQMSRAIFSQFAEFSDYMKYKDSVSTYQIEISDIQAISHSHIKHLNNYWVDKIS